MQRDSDAGLRTSHPIAMADKNTMEFGGFFYNRGTNSNPTVKTMVSTTRPLTRLDLKIESGMRVGREGY